jgi:hypothetical protein
MEAVEKDWSVKKNCCCESAVKVLFDSSVFSFWWVHGVAHAETGGVRRGSGKYIFSLSVYNLELMGCDVM